MSMECQFSGLSRLVQCFLDILRDGSDAGTYIQFSTTVTLPLPSSLRPDNKLSFLQTLAEEL
jgi:hypothetical protein